MNKGLKEILSEKTALIEDEVINLRRHFHRYPELSYEERNTSEYICNYLKNNEIAFRRGIAGTGVIGRIDGDLPSGRVAGIRAEMDALPVQEINDKEYVSVNPGKMHACGHDAHMAMLLGVARIMNGMKEYFGGTILLVFQPGEEKSPGGAKLMIGTGELYNPKPDIMLAHHVMPDLETGMTGYKPGKYMASCDEIYMTVKGKGGHAALPALTTDQIYIASQLVVRLKDTFIELQKLHNVPGVLGIGKISGEGATNVIPEKVEIAGTLRTFDEGFRSTAISMVKQTCMAVEKEFEVKVDLRIAEGYPVLVNDERLTMKAIELSRELLGSKNVHIYTDLRMSSDDFSFYSELCPTIYFRVGSGSPGKPAAKLHTPAFDIDEKCLKTGILNMCWLLFDFLSND
ncbi:MAG: amidohydrolase [Bacteroidales bacterium]|nr:amidohydrolase [Bacteroidales bacterium]